MPAIFKLVVTRPSLTHKFWFESVLDPDTNYLAVPPHETDMTAWISNHPGMITSYYEEVISYEEIESRENEISSDSKSIFFLPRESYPILEDFNWAAVAGADPKLVPMFNWGFTRQPPYNPFSLSYTFIMEFDTIEHLQASYEQYFTVNTFHNLQNQAETANNTLKLYIDGVEVVPQ